MGGELHCLPAEARPALRPGASAGAVFRVELPVRRDDGEPSGDLDGAQVARLLIRNAHDSERSRPRDHMGIYSGVVDQPGDRARVDTLLPHRAR